MANPCPHASIRVEVTVGPSNREPGSATVRTVCNDCGAQL